MNKASDILRLFDEFIEKLYNLYSKESSSIAIDTVSYTDAMRFFVENKDLVENKTATKGAIFRKSENKGYLLYQVFLNDNNEIVSGRQLKANSFDEELTNTFGDKDLIIVE